MTEMLVVIAGIVQLGIACSSLAIPRILGWRQQIARLEPMTAQVFWVYAGYILGTNLFFGLLSVLVPHWLADGAPLARTLCGFIALYWGARMLIQVFAYATTRPRGRFHDLAHAGFTVLFVYLALVYGGLAVALL